MKVEAAVKRVPQISKEAAPYRTELTPVSFLRRSAYVYPDRTAVVGKARDSLESIGREQTAPGCFRWCGDRSTGVRRRRVGAIHDGAWAGDCRRAVAKANRYTVLV